MIQQKISPCLWFNNNAEEAVNFYLSIFKDSKIGDITRYDAASAEVSGQPEGSVLTVEFQIEGQYFMALNGGPIFKFTEAVSFVVDCETQEEVDYYWNKLSEGGDEKSQQCGWLKDQFGLSWQIVPKRLNEMLKSKDVEKAARAMKAMLEMKKIDLQKMEEAYEGESD